MNFNSIISQIKGWVNSFGAATLRVVRRVSAPLYAKAEDRFKAILSKLISNLDKLDDRVFASRVFTFALFITLLAYNIVVTYQNWKISKLQEANIELKSEYTRTLIEMDSTLVYSVRAYRREVLADKQFFSELVYSSTEFGPCIESMLALHKGVVHFKSQYYQDSVLLKDAKELRADYEEELKKRAKNWRNKWGYSIK